MTTTDYVLLGWWALLLYPMYVTWRHEGGSDRPLALFFALCWPGVITVAVIVMAAERVTRKWRTR